jgi:uncharacterized membrane protein
MRVGIQEDDQLDDATRAFDDLRAEVAVLRRAVEALGPALKENRSPDYSLSLGQIAKTQAAIGTRLEAIEAHPALRMTPAAFGEQLERAVTKASREARREAEDLVQGISIVSRDVQAMLGSARTREVQNWRLLEAGTIGLVAGLILFPLLGFPLARNLPFASLPDTLAASAMGEDPWRAGMTMMSRADPQKWDAIVNGWRRAEAAGDELKGCYEAARKSAKEQHCSVVIKVPAQ